MGYIEDDLIISLYLHRWGKRVKPKKKNWKLHCKHMEFHTLIWKIRKIAIRLYPIRLNPWLSQLHRLNDDGI